MYHHVCASNGKHTLLPPYAKDPSLLRQTTIWRKSLNLLIFDLLKGHVICIYLYKPLMTFLNNLIIMFFTLHLAEIVFHDQFLAF